LSVTVLEEAIAGLITTSVSVLPPDYLEALTSAFENESSPLGKSIIERLLLNARLSEEHGIATCQDTGMAIVFIEVGQEVVLSGGSAAKAVEAGVGNGYANLRKSVVNDPIHRVNTGDNTPPIIHWEVVPGDQVTLTLLLKGFGAEMMSDIKMLTPAQGVEGIKSFVLDVVRRAGPNACPPVIVGVGIGSSFDGVALLAKRALLRPLGRPNNMPHLRDLEAELFEKVNALDIGPQGFGGHFTALGVHIEAGATHIAALPVAVNLNCSAPRRATTRI